MSIRVTSKVWEHSAHKGTTLLVLLSLADQANDEGWCWPSIGTIAAKSRMSERQVQRAIQSLAASGEIEIAAGAGPGKVNRYRVLTERLGRGPAPADIALDGDDGGDNLSPLTVTPVSPPDAGEGVTSTVVEGDIHGQKGVTPVSPKPLKNRQEPRRAGARASAASRGDARAPAEADLPSPAGAGFAKAGAQAWQRVRERLHAEAGAAAFDTWLAGLEPAEVGSVRVVLHAPGAFVRDWVAPRYGGLLRTLWTEALGRRVAVEIVVPGPERDLFAASAAAAPCAPSVEPGASIPRSSVRSEGG